MKYKGYECQVSIDDKSCHLICTISGTSGSQEFGDKVQINEVVQWFRDQVDLHIGRKIDPEKKLQRFFIDYLKKIDPSIISDDINYGLKLKLDREIIARKMADICYGICYGRGAAWIDKQWCLDAADAIISYVEEVVLG